MTGYERFTTMRISINSFDRIFVLKKTLELKDKKDYSYDDIIKRLLDMYEGLKIA